ncbi:unnamed protein product [Linum trigynum]|uniref:Uncharacterized protein n=1 Tax=Linum trigynum TaxID=586398 RepID=A0AAV2CM96_9ROSI
MGRVEKEEEIAKGVSSRFSIERKKGARFRLGYGGGGSSGKKGAVSDMEAAGRVVGEEGICFRSGYGGGGSSGKKEEEDGR